MIAALVAAVFGLIAGSFLNVCIHRLPRDLSALHPRRSFCPTCGRRIPGWCNIPVVSYLLLKGRCLHCRTAIPLRYPIVEALTSASFFGAVLLYGISLAAGRLMLLAALTIALTFTDIEERILPDEMTLGGAVLGVLFAAFVPMRTGLVSMLLFRHGPRTQSIAESVIGALFGSLVVWLIGEAYVRIRHREGLGFGDVKMLAMIGAFLGLEGSLLTMMLGSVMGAISGVIFIKATGREMSSYELPFGAFLGAGALIVAFLGDPALRWYTHAG